MLIENLTWEEFADAVKKYPIVILPIGPIEQHGPHLPLGADYIQPYEVSQLVAKKINVLIAPPLPVGSCKSTAEFTGTIPVSPDTLRAIVRDFCIGFVKHGVRGIIIFNGHSGSLHIPAIDLGIMDALELFPKVRIASVTFSSLCRHISDKVIEDKNDVHAGEAESSRMLCLKPELVRRNKAVCEHPQFPAFKVLKPGDYRSYMKTGVMGNALGASEDKGVKLIEESVCNLVTLIKDFYKMVQ